MEWGLLTTEVESELKRLEKYISLLKKKKKQEKIENKKCLKSFIRLPQRNCTCKNEMREKNEIKMIPYKMKSVQYFAQRVVN